MNKKISSLILTTGILIILGFFFPSTIKAQIEIPKLDKPLSQMTVPELQAKIIEITKAIQQLQAILSQLTGPGIQGIPSDYTFTKNLKYGQSSVDVKYLQIFLNSDPDTQVFQSGAGSPGQETMYFGQRTKQAVIKFQENHSIPNTGYVGPMTRAKLNELLQSTLTPTTAKSTCGDNIIQTPNSTGIYEICDNTQLGGQSCQTRGYTGGTLSCSSNCITFDIIRCTSGGEGDQPTGPVCGDNTDKICPSGCNHNKDIDCTYCGDNILQSPNNNGVLEVCDTNVLNNQTCITKGFPGGTLKCSSTCLTFDTSSCTPPPPPNQAPVLALIGNKLVNENQQLTFQISATDPDQDTLTYSTSNLPTGSTFTNKTFTWIPSYTQSGTYTITFTVSDSKLTDTKTITITVNNVNRAPILNAIGNKTITQNNTLTFTISGSDPDQNTLTYSASGLSAGATFNSSTKTFSWIPSVTGTYNTTFTVSDGSLTASETITITVNSLPPSNNPPTAFNQNITFNEDNSVSITLSATDPNGDPLTYSIVSQPSRGTISGTLPNIIYTPFANYNGTNSFTFKANDGKVDSNTATISLTINPVNDAPILNSIGSKSINENSTLTFIISGTDIDGDTLYYSVQNSPSGAIFNSATRTFTWTPSYVQSGIYNVTFIVSDSELTAQETITIIVNDVVQNYTLTINTANGSVSKNPDQTSYVSGTVVTLIAAPNSGYTFGSWSGDLTGTTNPATITMNSNKIVTANFSVLLVCGDNSCNGTETCSTCPQDCGTCPSASSCTSITQFGITWTFNKAYQCGQFANGDYWVIGPVTITGISPSSTNSGGRVKNGSIVNPSPANESQGFDNSFAYASYNASLNKALNVSSNSPLVLSAGSSLVSTISMDAAGALPQLKTAAILTVLSAAPAAGSFRPPYCGTDKTIKFNKNNLNYSRLGKLSTVSSQPRIAQQAGDAQGSSVERMFERPWIDLIPNWTNRYIHPADNMPDYGRDLSDQIGTAALVLNLDLPNSTKETLLIRFVQLGIDLYGIVANGGQNNWNPDGGHASGRKWPILFAGIVLDDPSMKAIGTDKRFKSFCSDYAAFGEDLQAFYVSQADVDIKGHRDSDGAKQQDYLVGDIGLPEWGIRHYENPIYDDRNWQSNTKSAYRTCCTANSWAGFVLAAQIMGAKQLWNHDALFDYTDRYMEIEAFLGSTGTYTRQWSRFPEEMWDKHRASFGCVWTRDNLNDIYSNGHRINCGVPTCFNTDTSCGTYPSCTNCNNLDSCSGTTWQDYGCSGTSCIIKVTDSCTDCSCSCGGYNITESTSNNNCSDGKDNDCDGQIDSADTGCQITPECTTGQTKSCTTGLAGICSSGTQTCQSNRTWGSCVQNNQPTIENFSDSQDNDCDGTTDCGDSDCSAIPTCQSVIPTGYIAYYKFEGNTNDEKGTNNGTIYGNPQFVTGVQGQALSFDGADDYVNVGSLGSFGATPGRTQMQQGCTISVWIKTSSTTGMAILGEGTLFYPGFGITLNLNQYGNIAANTILVNWRQTNAFGAQFSKVYSTITNGNWHHILVVIKITGTQILYVDGVSQSISSYTDTFSSYQNWSLSNLYVGADPLMGKYFNGLIDDVMIFNRALSASEIQSIYNNQKPIASNPFLNNLASTLSAIQEILKKIQLYF